jgi:hypothetical protein
VPGCRCSTRLLAQPPHLARLGDVEQHEQRQAAGGGHPGRRADLLG